MSNGCKNKMSRVQVRHRQGTRDGVAPSKSAQKDIAPSQSLMLLLKCLPRFFGKQAILS